MRPWLESVTGRTMVLALEAIDQQERQWCKTSLNHGNLTAQPQNPEITLLVYSWLSCVFLSVRRFGQKVSAGSWDRGELGGEKLLRSLSLFIQYCHDHVAGTLLWNEPAHAMEWLIYVSLHFSEVSLWENSACFTVTTLNDRQYPCCTWVKSLFIIIIFISFILFLFFVCLFCFVAIVVIPSVETEALTSHGSSQVIWLWVSSGRRL